MTSSLVLGRSRDRDLAELMAQLKAHTFRSRLRTLEFFRCDDPMRTGTMSRERFGRGLLSTGFRYSPVELETICDAYEDPNLSDKGGAPFVRYGRFVEDLDGVFGVRELETKPECDVDAVVKAARAFFTSSSAADDGGGSPTNVCPVLSPEEEEIVMETLREIGTEVYRRRLSLAPPLRDFDRFNRGVVPGTMFERALSSAGLLPVRRKAKLLRRKFAECFTSPDSRSDVNYIAFLAAVEMAAAGHEKIPDKLLVRANANSEHRHDLAAGPGAGDANGTNVMTTGSGGGGSRGTGCGTGVASVQSVVQEVARQLAVGWVDITDFLSDADRLKQGEISCPKLKVALALAGVLLTDEELRILQSGFRSDRNGDMVDWRRLAVAVNKIGGGAPVAMSWNGEVFDPSTAAASSGRRSRSYHHQPPDDPSRLPPSAAPSLGSPPSIPSSPLAPAPSTPLGRTQDQHQHRCGSDATIDSTTGYAAGGTSSSGGGGGSSDTLNRAAARHLGSVKFQTAPVGGSGRDAGGGRRLSSPTAGTTARVGGVRDGNGAGAGGGAGGGSVGSGTGRGGLDPIEGAGDAVDAEVLNKSLDAVRHRVKHYRMDLKPSFQDFDRNRGRKITREQFLSVLGNMGLNLSEREQDAICRRYTVHERSPGTRVRYAAFCDDIEPEHVCTWSAKGAAY